MHLCLDAGCLAGCVAYEESLNNCKLVCRITIGRLMPEGLLYRWKEMDRCLAYTERGRKHLDLLLGVLRRMWSKKDLDDAVRLGELCPDISILAGETKTKIKANSVLKAFEADPNGNLVVKASILTTPLQSCLNKVLVADKNVTKLTEVRGGFALPGDIGSVPACTGNPSSDLIAVARTRKLEGVVAKGNADFFDAQWTSGA